MSKSVIAVVALTTLFALLCFNNSPPRAAEQVVIVVPKWEYTTVVQAVEDFESKPKLNEWLTGLGNEGWELCDCVTMPQARQCIFKRQKR